VTANVYGRQPRWLIVRTPNQHPPDLVTLDLAARTGEHVGILGCGTEHVVGMRKHDDDASADVDVVSKSVHPDLAPAGAYRAADKADRREA
jgi:hypothetical protein